MLNHLLPICPYCSGKAKKLFSGKDYNRRVSKVIFHLYACEKCGLWFVSNPPDNLGDYYTEDYHGEVTIESLANSHSEKPKIDFLTKYKNSGDLLEIGPSMGAFCYEAKDVGFNVSAIEMNAKCVKFLNEQMKIRAVCSDNPAKIIEQEKLKYDVICMWHSLEHIPEPWKILDAVAKALKVGGILVIAVPNPNAWQIKIMGKYWPHHDLPRHLFAFPVKWLENHLAKYGITLKAVTTKTNVNNYWNRFSWGMLFTYFCPSKFATKKDAVFRKGIKFKCFSKWEEKEGNGSTYVAVLEKQ